MWSRLMAVAAAAVCLSAVPAAAQSIGTDNTRLNVLFLVEAVAIWVVVVGIFFYWNRLLGVLCGFFLRLALWKSSNVWISFESIQFSPLAGRILFKNLRYHSSNMSIRVLKGHVTWRFWKWRVRSEGKLDDVKLPCRCSVYLEGMEWFLYNRTPAYDAIIERMKQNSTEAATEAAHKPKISEDGPRRRWGRRSSPATDTTTESEKSAGPPKRPLSPPIAPVSRARDRVRRTESHAEQQVVWNWQRDLLPIEIVVSTGAVVVGSDATPTVTIAEFKDGNGTYEACESRSKLDLYRQLARFHLTMVKVLMRTNPDYTGPLLDHGKRAYERLAKEKHNIREHSLAALLIRSGFHAVAKAFPFLHDSAFSRPPTSAAAFYGENHEWKGLARYRDTGGKDAMRNPSMKQIEYAKVATILQTPAMDLEYYVDVAGTVPPLDHPSHHTDDAIGNADRAPEWGIDVVTHGGDMTYGPWADRQRDAIMRAFTPSIFFHSDPEARLQPGDPRKHTEIKIFVELVQETSLRMATRQPSQDWHFSKANDPSHVRSYGWLDLKVGPKSSVRYTLPIVASHDGYKASLDLHLDDLRVETHVNYKTFLTAKSCCVAAKMPTPLQWDGRRDWKFTVDMDEPDIYLLRDHVTLIADLAKDWNSGAVGDFLHFIPYDYQFFINLHKYKIRLYLNDFNVVNLPLDHRENTFLTLHGDKIMSGVEIPSVRYRPESTTIPFDVTSSDVHLTMSVPTFHTQHTFGTGESKAIGKIGSLDVQGSYLYYNRVESDHAETLSLTISLDTVSFRLIGWAIRKLILLKDNYFGSFTHFKTSEEFLEGWAEEPPIYGDPIEDKHAHSPPSDLFEVNLDLSITNGVIIAPERIFDCRAAAVIPVQELDLHLRTNGDFMELVATIPPTSLYFVADTVEVFQTPTLCASASDACIFIDGIRISADRLFGMPPRDPTYLCIWDFTLGKLSGAMDLTSIWRLLAVQQAFSTTFADIENGPAPEYSPMTDPDATFVGVRCGETDLRLGEGSHATQLHLPHGLALNTSSWAGQSYSAAIALVIQSIRVRMLSAEDAISGLHREVAILEGALHVHLFGAPEGWRSKGMKQHDYIRRQDATTQRLYADRPGCVRTEATSRRHGPFLLPTPFRNRHSDNNTSASSTDDGTTMSDTDGSESGTSSSGSSAAFDGSALSFKQMPAETGAPSQTSDGGDSASEFGPSSASSLRSFAVDRRVDDGHQADQTIFAALPRFQLDSSSSRAVFKAVGPSFCLYDFEIPAGVSTGPVAAEAHQSDLDEYTVGSPSSSATFVRIHSSKGLRLGFTPHLLTAVECFESAWVSHVPDIEGMLDDVHVARIKAFTKSPRSGASFVNWDIALPHICIAAAQDLHPSPRTGQEGAVRWLTSTLSLRQLKLDVVRRQVTSRGGQIGTATGDGKIDSIDLKISPRLPEGRSAPTIQPLVGHLTDLTSSATRSGFGRTHATLSAKSLHLECSPTFASIASAAILAWDTARSITVKAAGNPINPFFDHAASLSDWLRDHPEMQQPQCLHTRNELLVSAPRDDQTGSAHPSPRDDLGWRVLCGLRLLLRVRQHAIRNFSPSPGSNQGETPEHKRRRMIERLGGWMYVDPAEIFRLPFLTPVADRQAAEVDGTRPPAPASLHLLLEYATFVVAGTKEAESPPIGSIAFKGLSIDVSHATRLGQLRVVKHGMSIGLALQEVNCQLYPSLLETVRGFKATRSEVLRPPKEPQATPSDSVPATHTVLEIGLTLCVKRAGLTTHAHSLSMVIEGRDILCGTVLESPGVTTYKQMRGSVSCSVDSIRTALKSHEDDLVDIEARTVQCYLQLDLAATRSKVKARIRTGNLFFRSPQDPQHVYGIIRAWREEYFSQYEPALRSLIAERAGKPQGLSSTTKAETKIGKSMFSSLPAFYVDLSIQSISLIIAISPRTWIFWHLAAIYASALSAVSGPGNHDKADFGFRLGDQKVGFTKTAGWTPSLDAQEVSLHIPSIRAMGSLQPGDNTRLYLRCSLRIEAFIGSVKPAVIERFLSSYKAISQDVRALILFSEAALANDISRKQPSTQQKASASGPTLYDINVESRGLMIHFGASRTPVRLKLRTSRVLGRIRNVVVRGARTDATENIWDVVVSGLRLSIGQLSSSTAKRRQVLDEKAETASVLFDIGLGQHFLEAPGQDPVKTANLHVQGRILKAIAVMQVVSLSQAYDLLDNWSTDAKAMRARRAEAWSGVIEDTTKLIKTENRTAPLAKAGWLDTHLISLDVRALALAIPLEIQQRGANALRASAVPALLFAVGGVNVENRRGQVGRAEVRDIAIQFVREFDTTNDDHYDPSSHMSGNKMHLPSTRIEVCYNALTEPSRISIRGVFTGFELRIDTNVVEYARLFLDVYSLGRERIERFVEDYPIEREGGDLSIVAATKTDRGELAHRRLLCRTSLEFYSGRVLLFPLSDADFVEGVARQGASGAMRILPLDRSKRLVSSADVLVLPGISTWVVYDSGAPANDGSFTTSAIIHSSENTLRPSLIPFLTAIVQRLRHTPFHASMPVEKPSGSAVDCDEADALGISGRKDGGTLNKLRLAMSLRVARSTLDLSCQPDSPVLAGIAWESGGFTIQKAPGTQKLLMTAQVSTVTLRSRHAYLVNQESVAGGIRQLVASGMWNPKHKASELSAQVILNFDLVADVRMPRFQDLLCLQAVWIDRIPVSDLAGGDSPVMVTRHETGAHAEAPSSIRRRLIMCRCRRLQLEGDLVVSQVRLSIEPLLLRSDWQREQDIALDMKQVTLTATGSIAGQIVNRSIELAAIRKNRELKHTSPTLLDLHVGIGPTVGHMDIEGQRMARLHLMPSAVTLRDDWYSFEDRTTDQSLELAFCVTLGALDAILSADGAPGLLDGAERLARAYHDQVGQAEAESLAYRQYRTDKPTNALASVTVAMQQSAKQRQGESSLKSFKIIQALQLESRPIRVALYRSSDYAKAFYRLDIREALIHFERDLTIGGSPLRKLTAKLEGVRLRRFTPKTIGSARQIDHSVAEWLQKASTGTELRVVSLPNTVITMSSVQDMAQRVLGFDYDVKYGLGSRGRLELNFELGVFFEISNMYKDLKSAIKRSEDLIAGERATTDDLTGTQGDQVSKVVEDPQPEKADPLTYKGGKVNLRPPPMNILGEFSEDLLGKYTEKWLRLAPEATHQFETGVLENGMEILLKVYEQLLPT